MTPLQSKIAVVTGASSGLGQAIAAALAEAGAAVVGGARRFHAMDATLSEGHVSEVHLDVTDEARVVKLFREVPADVVVNCAGHGSFGSFLETTVTDLRAMLDVHVVGAFLCAREALRGMRARGGGGHIVNVSSIAAHRTLAGSAGYTAAKEGLRGLTRVLTEEARPDIRVTGLYPGALDTPIWDGREGFDRSHMMRPADLAALVVDFVSRPSISVEELVVLPPRGVL
jgi:NAD(P)-dependent dehydrogenase (short-subunit alcohol dehydrogenase family)